MTDAIPFQLMAADSPDPQGTAISLADVLRTLSIELDRQRDLLLSGRALTAVELSLTRARAVELADLGYQALQLNEAASIGRRARGLYRATADEPAAP